jgi:hypothetical protein
MGPLYLWLHRILQSRLSTGIPATRTQSLNPSRRLVAQREELEEIDRDVDRLKTEKKVLDQSLQELRRCRWKILLRQPRERKAKPVKK